MGNQRLSKEWITVGGRQSTREQTGWQDWNVYEFEWVTMDLQTKGPHSLFLSCSSSLPTPDAQDTELAVTYLPAPYIVSHLRLWIQPLNSSQILILFHLHTTALSSAHFLLCSSLLTNLTISHLVSPNPHPGARVSFLKCTPHQYFSTGVYDFFLDCRMRFQLHQLDYQTLHYLASA